VPREASGDDPQQLPRPGGPRDPRTGAPSPPEEAGSSTLDKHPRGSKVVAVETLEVSYRIRSEPGGAAQRARAIAVEQTVEVPETLITPAIEKNVVGRVVELREESEGVQIARIRYPAALVAGEFPRLLNLIYGNTSMHSHVRVIDLQLPPSVLDAFGGPRFGTGGIRKLLGVHGRPLLISALKPNGAPNERLVAVARAFARGGGDIVKDDQNLFDENLAAWRERVTRCHEAVEEGNAQTGRRCLYFPYLSGRLEEAEERLGILHELGVRGVLVAPFLLGLEAARSLAQRHPLVMMAHPSFSGPYYLPGDSGMEADLVLGTLLRLAGMDISIFVNAGGRFGFERAVGRAIAARLREPLGALRSAMPSPAGGMRLENLDQMAEDYGAETGLLIGGALLTHSRDLSAATRHFLDAIRGHFPERLEPPDDSFLESSCEWPSPAVTHRILHHLTHRGDFRWEGRRFVDYKSDDRLPFSGVRRLELIGPAAERTAFELRYFEVEPGGFTSLEKHRHTHVLIGVRGRGIVVRDGERTPLLPLDIAYIDEMVTHQLRNEEDEPFGFFCLVDRRRDRPLAP